MRLTCAVVLKITWSNFAKLVVSRINQGTVCQTERHLLAEVLGFHSDSLLNLCRLKHCFVIREKNFFIILAFGFVSALVILFQFDF